MLDFTLDFAFEHTANRAEAAGFDLRRVMDSLAALVAHKAEDKALELVFIEPPGLATALVGDALGLLQALVCLASDAIRFTDRGEVVIAIEQLARQVDSCDLRFVVRGGEAAFDSPAADPHREETHESEGLALGLEAAARRVALLGGHLEMRKLGGGGGEFAFSLKFERQPVARRAVPSLPTGLAGTRVLVVDDSAATRRALLGLAAPLGFLADAAADAREAVRAVRHAIEAGRPYDVVLIDESLPGGSGLACAEELVAASRGGCPVALMTTYAGREALRQRVEASGLAVSDLLIKPVTPARFMSTCAAVTGLASRTAPTTELAGLASVAHRERLVVSRILLVEDNDINAELAMQSLLDAGLTVARAHDGHEALRLLEARSFAAVLMDCQLPGWDAWQVTRAIRAEARWAGLPIIAMSANATLPDRARALAAGMNDLTAKPIDPTALFATLAAWIGPAPSAAGAQAPGDDWIALPGIDARVGRVSTMGDDRLYRRLMLRFRDAQLDFTAQFRRATNVADAGVAARLVHDLRAMAGTLGVLGVERLAASLEAALSGRSSVAGIEGPLGALVEEMRRVNLGLRHLAAE